MRVWGPMAEGLERRGGAVLVSIREALGSTPREAGARMIVFADGSFTGTIGGGTLEWRAIAEAQRLLTAGTQAGATIAARHDTAGSGDSGAGQGAGTDGAADLATAYAERSYALGPELGQCCGGRVTIGYETLTRAELGPVRRLAEREAAGEVTVVRTVVGGMVERRIMHVAHDGAGVVEIERFGSAVRTLYLFGAGHVGRALVLALAPLPFRIVWVDPRAEAFPRAVPGNVTMVQPRDPVATLAGAPAGAFVLIMTHSHALDLALCDAALRLPGLKYVGVIGSATKRARFERRLAEAGVADADIARLVCPIGATGPTSKLPAVIAAATAVELLVADEMCLKVRQTDGVAGSRQGDAPAAGVRGVRA